MGTRRGTDTPDPDEIIAGEVVESVKKQLWPLVGLYVPYLSVPLEAIILFEPSQVGTVVGTIVDACIPHIAEAANVGLKRHPGILLDREGYPDFLHADRTRVELKGLFDESPDLALKKALTPREASARLTQKVTVKNVDPKHDVLLVLAYRLAENPEMKGYYSPLIIDLDVFPMIHCILARDQRLRECGGRWFGDFETPVVPSKIGRSKLKLGKRLNTSKYGRKESEGHDFNEDTNFGKLKRIPYEPLQRFLKKHGASYASSGNYPTHWTIE